MAATVFSLAACGSSENSDDTGDNEQVVNVYASRHYDADRDMYAAFEDLTGIKVNLREAGAAQLLETVKAEGGEYVPRISSSQPTQDHYGDFRPPISCSP